MFTHGKINTTHVNLKPKLQPKPVTEEPIILEPKDETIEIKEKEPIKLEGPIDMKRPPEVDPPIPVKPKLETQSISKKKNNKKKAETQVSENEKVSE